MLWVALHFPQLRRQALSRGHAPPEPEREALAAVAAWACQFTPRVSLEPPQALLMEVEGGLRCFGGRWKFLARLRAGLIRLGFEARVAEAPTARAALWKARAGGGRLEALPVAVTGLAPEALTLIENLGVKTLGGLMRLPRAGLVSRLGQGLLDELDQAHGKLPEPRRFFVPPTHFSVRLVLSAPMVQADRALFVARRLLEEMEGFLAARHAGVRNFSLHLLHEDPSETEVRVRLAACGRDAKHFTRLLQERLAQLALRAAVEAIGIEAGEMEVLPEESRSFLRDPSADDAQWLGLVERLQSRLGNTSVHGLSTHPDPRPERAWRPVFPGRVFSPMQERKSGPGLRPLWLLDRPRRLAEGEFSLLAGPERIESGWWDGDEAQRDYFIARTGQMSLAWIYRQSGAAPGRSWYLHGFFA
jgi:protein ImuB